MNVIECCKCRNSPSNRRALSPANRSRLIFSCPLPSLPPRLRVRSADSPPSFPWEVPFRLRAVPLLCPFHVPSTLTIDWNFGVCEGEEGEGRRTTPLCKRRRVEAVRGIVSDFSSGPKEKCCIESESFDPRFDSFTFSIHTISLKMT